VHETSPWNKTRADEDDDGKNKKKRKRKKKKPSVLVMTMTTGASRQKQRGHRCHDDSRASRTMTTGGHRRPNDIGGHHGCLRDPKLNERDIAYSNPAQET
jgi:hypothetical protein